MSQVDIPSDASDWLKTCYLCVTTMAMGFELIAVLNSTLCSMLGPGLALRGPDGSMHRAVDGLMLEYRLTFLFFVMGLIAFHASALLFAWLEFSWPVALAMTVALVVFLYAMWRYFKRIYKRFSLDRCAACASKARRWGNVDFMLSPRLRFAAPGAQHPWPLLPLRCPCHSANPLTPPVTCVCTAQ